MNIKKLRFILKILMVISLCIFPLFFNLISGIALIHNAQVNISGGLIEYTDYICYKNMGAVMALSSILMLCATLCIFVRKDLIAVIIEIIGLFMCIAVLFRLRNISLKNGLSDESLIPYADIYLRRHLPTAIHSLIVCLLAYTDYFSDVRSLSEKKDKNTTNKKINDKV